MIEEHALLLRLFIMIMFVIMFIVIFMFRVSHYLASDNLGTLKQIWALDLGHPKNTIMVFWGSNAHFFSRLTLSRHKIDPLFSFWIELSLLLNLLAFYFCRKRCRNGGRKGRGQRRRNWIWWGIFEQTSFTDIKSIGCCVLRSTQWLLSCGGLSCISPLPKQVDANKSNQADLRQDFGFRIEDCAGCCAECLPYQKCQYCYGIRKCDNECKDLNRDGKVYDCIVLWRRRKKLQQYL